MRKHTESSSETGSSKIWQQNRLNNDSKRDNHTILGVSEPNIMLQRYSLPAVKMQAWTVLHSFSTKLSEQLTGLQWEVILGTTLSWRQPSELF